MPKKTLIACEVVKAFRDRKSGRLHLPGATVRYGRERLAEINAVTGGPYLAETVASEDASPEADD